MFTIETEGLGAAMDLLQTLASKSRITGVVCNAKDRVDSDLNNVQIMVWLAKSGRDFFSMDNHIVNDVEVEMVKVIEKELTKGLKRKYKKDKVTKKISIRDKKREHDALRAKAFRAGMKTLLKEIVARIEQQRLAGGGSPKQLSEEYQVEKEFKHGFTIPIGVATGQLLDNCQPDSRNIKLGRS